MRIVKQGDIQRLKRWRRFCCHNCGCVFDAEGGEYACVIDNYHYSIYKTFCPTCGSIVYGSEYEKGMPEVKM